MTEKTTTYLLTRATLEDGERLNVDAVQLAWDTYVRPDQEREVPQSGEMRVLMAILRALWVAYNDGDKNDDDKMQLGTPLVAPFGWEVDDAKLVQEAYETFVRKDGERPDNVLAALLTSVADAIRAAQ